jgi:hypothetical protein
MVEGNFDMAKDTIYWSLPNVIYAPEVALAQHTRAREIKLWFHEHFRTKPNKRPFATSLPNKIWPAFIHVPGSKAQQKGTGKDNPKQAMVITEFVKEFLGRFPGISIGVLTPYRAQRTRLQKALEKTPALVSTIDGIQGREADVIVYNLVVDSTTKNPMFIANMQRHCVAIT